MTVLSRKALTDDADCLAQARCLFDAIRLDWTPSGGSRSGVEVVRLSCYENSFLPPAHGGAIIVPIAVFAAVALQILLRSERERALRSLDETVVSSALLVDRELNSAEAALRVLARSPNLSSGDMVDFYEHARTAHRGVGGRTVLYDADGEQIISTRVPAGTKLDLPPDSVRQRIRLVIDDRPQGGCGQGQHPQAVPAPRAGAHRPGRRRNIRH